MAVGVVWPARRVTRHASPNERSESCIQVRFLARLLSRVEACR